MKCRVFLVWFPRLNYFLLWIFFLSTIHLIWTNLSKIKLPDNCPKILSRKWKYISIHIHLFWAVLGSNNFQKMFRENPNSMEQFFCVGLGSLYVLSFMFRFMFANICFVKNQNIKIHVMFITKHNMKWNMKNQVLPSASYVMLSININHNMGFFHG